MPQRQKWIAITTLLLILGLPVFAFSQTWPGFIEKMKEEGKQAGISQKTLNLALDHLQAPNPIVKTQSTHQPEQTITYPQYIKSRADNARIQMGIKEFKHNQKTLQKIQKQYGVNACVLTAIWGLESSYGNDQGKFPVIQSLATLGFQSSRKDFYQKELLIALKMVDDKQISLSQFKGAWAGASGQPQFMPSSWETYAIDFNGDGRKDIWTNTSDALASAANFLKQNGWKSNQPIMIPVTLPQNFNKNLINKKTSQPVAHWLKLGIAFQDSQRINKTLPAYIAQPDGGPTFMVFTNFTVIKHWNNSIYFVGAVNTMAKAICSKNHMDITSS